MKTAGLPQIESKPEVQARSSVMDGQALYPLMMGADWSNLDSRIQHFHCAPGSRSASGIFQVRRGKRAIARFLAWFLHLPEEGNDVSTRLTVRCEPGSQQHGSNREIWNRCFGKQRLDSIQYTRKQYVLAERFGFVELSFHLRASQGALVFEPVAAALVAGPLRLPLPASLGPNVTATITGSERLPNSFEVSVHVAAPLVGTILSYQGHLEPQEATA